MQDDARSVLSQLISAHGQDLVDDHRRLRSMLADSLPSARREAQRLVAAAEEGIPRQILNAGSDSTGALRLQLAKRLQDERDMTPEAADWTVDSWAAALNVDLGGPLGGSAGDATRTIQTEHRDDDLPPPASRRGLWIAGAAAAGVIVALVLVMNLNPFRSGDVGSVSASPSASSEPTQAPSEVATPSPILESLPPTPSPTASIQPVEELRSRINPAIRSTCSESTWKDFGEPLAQLECEIAGMDSISYLLYESLDDMRAGYENWVFVDKGGGDCADNDVPAEAAWAKRPYLGHALGRYSCFLSDEAWMVWTAEYARIVSIGHRQDKNMSKLWAAWSACEVRPIRSESEC